jgi:hypothetical protein
VITVPLGQPLTVTLRAGHFAGGCVDISGLTGGAENSVSRIEVAVSDRPLQMAEASFDLTLQLADAPDWRAALEPTIATMASALIGDASNDADALLDAMESSASTPAVAAKLAAARDAAAWDTMVTGLWTDSQENPIRRAARQWIGEGLNRLIEDGTLTGRVEGDEMERATWTLSSVAGLDPGAAGFEAAQAVTWKAEPNDRVSVGAEDLSWKPSLLLAALADTAASSETSGAVGVADALGDSVACETLAARLLETSETLGSTCGASCLASTCRAALSELWERARIAASDATRLELVVSGQVVIDDAATPIGLDGEWVGNAILGNDVELRLDGPATGAPGTDAP